MAVNRSRAKQGDKGIVNQWLYFKELFLKI